MTPSTCVHIDQITQFTGPNVLGSDSGHMKRREVLTIATTAGTSLSRKMGSACKRIHSRQFAILHSEFDSL